MVDLYNTSNTIGQIITAGTFGVTGNLVATMFVVLILLVVISLMFGIPLEFISIIVLPFCLVVGAFQGEFMAPLIVILIYVSMLIAKNWLFR